MSATKTAKPDPNYVDPLQRFRDLQQDITVQRWNHKVVTIGLLINSALYLVSIIAVGLVIQNRMAWLGAVASIGVTYLSYFSQLCGFPARLSSALVFLSILLGVFAGISLMVL